MGYVNYYTHEYIYFFFRRFYIAALPACRYYEFPVAANEKFSSSNPLIETRDDRQIICKQ